MSARMRLDDPDVDLEALAREELIRLQRRYRLMEGDKHEYAQQSGTTISRAHRIMEYLRAEKEDLLTDYSNATCERHKEHDKKCQHMVVDQLTIYDRYQQEMKDKIAQILEEEAQVDKITDRIVKQRLKIHAAFGHSVTPAEFHKRQQTLENRLYHVTTWFDGRCSKNNAIRYGINLLLMERGNFHRRHLFMKRQIAKVKAKMLLSVYQAAQTYDSRDEDVAKMKALRERDEKESRQHVLEIKELQRILHHDEKGHHFIQQKNVHRDPIESGFERLSRLEGKKEMHVENLLRAYRKSVRQILKLAGIQDVEKLCNSYNEQEQRNFVRFQYISNLNSECEVIRDAINVLKRDIELSASNGDAKQMGQLDTLKQARDELSDCKAYLKSLNEELDFSNDKMQKILKSIEEVFHVAECNNSPVIQILGNFTGLHARNLKTCIEIMERTIGDLVQEKKILEMRQKVEIEGRPITKQMLQPSITAKPVAEGGPFKPKVVLTGGINPAGEDDEEKQMTKKPLYYKELYPIVYENMTIGGLITGHDDDSLHGSESHMTFASSHHINTIIPTQNQRPSLNVSTREQNKSLDKMSHPRASQSHASKQHSLPRPSVSNLAKSRMSQSLPRPSVSNLPKSRISQSLPRPSVSNLPQSRISQSLPRPSVSNLPKSRISQSQSPTKSRKE